MSLRGAEGHHPILLCSYAPHYIQEQISHFLQEGPKYVSITLQKAICAMVSSEKTLKSVVNDPSHVKPPGFLFQVSSLSSTVPVLCPFAG